MSVAAKPATKLPVIWLLRVGVSAAVLAVIFHFVPFGAVWAAARALPPALWLAALALFLLGHAAAAAKWRLLIGPGIGFAQAFRAHLAGLAANLAL
ncbi:MAG: lysylphosphatidylglycerol synthase domain-containing protein, partial [Polymorphobacter sp.]